MEAGRLVAKQSHTGQRHKAANQGIYLQYQAQWLSQACQFEFTEATHHLEPAAIQANAICKATLCNPPADRLHQYASKICRDGEYEFAKRRLEQIAETGDFLQICSERLYFHDTIRT